MDEYIPLLDRERGLGGTFDPFCGTMYDELKAGGGKAASFARAYRGRQGAGLLGILYGDPGDGRSTNGLQSTCASGRKAARARARDGAARRSSPWSALQGDFLAGCGIMSSASISRRGF